MEPHDCNINDLNFGLQRTSSFHFLWFWMNWYKIFFIYQREPQKAKTHHPASLSTLQRAAPARTDFWLSRQMGGEMSCCSCLILWTGI